MRSVSAKRIPMIATVVMRTLLAATAAPAGHYLKSNSLLGMTVGGLPTLTVPLDPAGTYGVTLNPAATEEVRTFTTLGGFGWSSPAAPIETRATVTLKGENDFTTSGAGDRIVLISPVRIRTDPLGLCNFPSFFSQELYVPEPGLAISSIAGIVALVIMGRGRAKR